MKTTSEVAERIVATKREHPNFTTRQIADKVRCSTTYASKILQKYSAAITPPKVAEVVDMPSTSVTLDSEETTYKKMVVRIGTTRALTLLNEIIESVR